MSSRINFLQKACSFGVLGILVAGCSSGFQRFDDQFYQSAVPQASDQSAYSSYPGAQGNLDTITTSSVRPAVPGNKRITPLSNVAPPQYPAGINHAPEPTYVAPQASYTPPQPYRAPVVQSPTYQGAATRQSLSTYNPQYSQNGASSSWQSAPVSRSQLSNPSVPAYNPPQPQAVYIPPAAPQTTDRMTTSSVAPKANVSVEAPISLPQKAAPSASALSERSGGWTSAGGTTITARQGETLYNLSKRYGVPVNEIMSANGMQDANGLQAGQKVLIPNYVFSQSSPVSAPDNNPQTRHSRASTGYIGEAKPNELAVPTKRPYYVAALNSKKTVSDSNVAGSATYKNSENASASERMGSTASAPYKQRETNVAAVDTTAKAPARSGISDFRWPVKGRVVGGFGDASGSGSNEGIDISVPEGTAVKAAENGVVIYAGNEISRYGNLILIRHADDWVSAYAHNKEFNVSKGDRVSRGQTIARSGKTGTADRPKLHFELRKNSKPVDPRKYLAS